jgi:hypothetical protein
MNWGATGNRQTAANITRHDDGSVLVEVMVAVILLAVLLVPLAAGMDTAVGRADGVGERAGELAERAGEVRDRGAWEWGPEVASAVWQPGPVLDLELESQNGSERIVGVWIDGWFLGERLPDDRGSVLLKASEMRDCTGGELVVRVRRPDEPWGPPWRSFVPDGTGEFSPSDASTHATGSVGGASAAPTSVVHAPCLANPAFALSWYGLGLGTEAGRCPLVLPTPTAGRCEISLDGQAQSWWMEAGRGLDLYF